ncbi:MAG: hypothetical protein WC004_01520, partial [Candidatus Absconditabacterales bacterium]
MFDKKYFTDLYINHFSDCLEYLKTHTTGTPHELEVLGYIKQYEDLRTKVRKGLIDFKEETVEQNKLGASVLSFSSVLQTYLENPTPSSPAAPTPAPAQPASADNTTMQQDPNLLVENCQRTLVQ